MMIGTAFLYVGLAALGLMAVSVAGGVAGGVDAVRSTLAPKGQIVVVTCDANWIMPGGMTRYEAVKIRKGLINHTLTLTDGRLVEIRGYQCRWETEFQK